MAQPDSTQIKQLESLVEKVRLESLAGELVRLDKVWNRTGEDFVALVASAAAESVSDLQVNREEDDVFLFSVRHMTRAYAESAARAATSDPQHLIAAVVRSDSATYPRPTAIVTFCQRPFSLSPEEVTAAIAHLAADPELADIQPIQASNGDRFLFSLRHLTKVQAQAIAEWLAVRQFENP